MTKLFAPCKKIKDSLGFWILRNGFRIPSNGFQFAAGTLDSHQLWDFGVLELYISGFQIPGFWIFPQANFPGFWTPQEKIGWIPESGFLTWGDIMHKAVTYYSFSQTVFVMTRDESCICMNNKCMYEAVGKSYQFLFVSQFP